MQFVSHGHVVDLSKEAVTPHQLFLGGVLEVGKALLHDRDRTVGTSLLSQVGPSRGGGAWE